MMGGPRRRGAPMPRMSIKGQGHILKRLMKIVFENYLWQFIAVIVCIVVTAYATIQSSTFTRDLVDVYIAGIQKGTKTMGDLANAMIPLGCVLALGVAASYIRQRLMVSVGQGTMLKIRTDLFTHMESLPIRYFDTHSHGDIMSIYTNDVDTLRQLISQSILAGTGGAWRMQGGGFAGTIQAFVPDALIKRYCAAMKALFGPGCCYLLSLREQGAVRVM